MIKVKWLNFHRKPTCPPNPLYPNGIDIDLAHERTDAGGNRYMPHSCTAPLRYPAKGCGAYQIECRDCGARILVTTAGRPDDPRSVTMTCAKPRPNLEERKAYEQERKRRLYCHEADADTQQADAVAMVRERRKRRRRGILSRALGAQSRL